MSEWTRGAGEWLEQWLDRMVSAVPPDTDPAEVREDLRAHVMLDVERARIPLVTEDDVRRITEKLGTPPRDLAPPSAEPERPAPHAPPPPSSRRALGPSPRRFTAFVALAGVLLPIAALLVESESHQWGRSILDPIPTPFHVGMIAAVAAANLLCLCVTENTLARHRRLLATLNGFAIAVSAVYSVLFLPGLPLALFGLIVLLGILPLSPFLALMASLTARRWLLRGGPVPRIAGVPAVLVGVVLALGLLIAFEVRGLVTISLIGRAASEDPDARLSAVRLLRRFGDERIMLAAARGHGRVSNRSSLLPAGLIVRRQVGTDSAAEVWYRVTGEPVPPDRSGWAGSGFLASDGSFERPDGPPLRLKASRLDGMVDAPGSNVYLEWTLSFRNVGFGMEEAVADILLPPGGVVSRATLWVEGEEREAAFAGRRQVEQAYEQVVSYRRDPLLVTSSGNERVLIRGFPVIHDKDFQIRIGMTAPLVIDTPVRGAIVLPRLAKRNFDLSPGLRHSVWIESRFPLRDGPAFAIEERPARGFSARAQIEDDQIGLESATLAVERPDAGVAVSPDQLTPADQKVVVQKIASGTARRPSRIVLVVDGGAAMKDHVADVAEAIARVPDGLELGVIYGGETIVDLGGGCRTTTRRVVQDLAGKLSDQEAIGGSDAVAALARGFELASESPHGAVVWLHARVGRALSPTSELLQSVERRPDDPKLYDFALTPDVDEVGKAIPPQRIQRIHRLGDVASDLARMFGWWTGARPKFTYERERVPKSAVPAGAVEATPHIGRLWASDRINRVSFPISSKGQDEALMLARTFQLVTPVSGAVVLESQQQFEAAGLQPVDPASAPRVDVPGVPEPHEWALLVVAALALGVLFFRRGRTARFA
jgi:hypothetical protein